MAPSDLIHIGADRFRVLPWQGDDGVAVVSPVPGGRPPAEDSVRDCLQLLAGRGVREVVTGALAQPELPGFLNAGFVVRERLHLLAHDLHELPPLPHRPRLRRGRVADHPAVLAVDAAAFEDFWRLDDTSLADALEATASSRFRVATGSGLQGYLITGRAGTRGYLQRLAVSPAHQREGIGTALVVDGLRWLRRHGVHRAVVNTQETNAAALAMYEHLGFRREPDGLAVLARPTVLA
jgi:ribosomal protein S18 acetylase RimI-like enzyme